MDQKGLWGTLLDLSFSSFITVKIVRVLYVIGIAMAGLLALGTLLGGFTGDGGAGMAILGLILAPIVFLVAVLAVRVYMELIIVIFKIAEHTNTIAEHLDGGGDIN